MVFFSQRGSVDRNFSFNAQVVLPVSFIIIFL